jgi:hypothetical protein
MSPPPLPFASSFSAFNLRNPTSAASSDPSSNGSGMQMDLETPFFRGAMNSMASNIAGGSNSSSSSSSANNSMSMTGNGLQHSRRQSMLNRQISLDDEEEEEDHDGRLSLLASTPADLSSVGDERSGTDSPMLFDSPIMASTGLPFSSHSPLPSSFSPLPTTTTTFKPTDTIRQRRQKANMKSGRSQGNRARSTSNPLSLPAPELAKPTGSASVTTYMMTLPFLSRRRRTEESLPTLSGSSSSSSKEPIPTEQRTVQQRDAEADEDEGMGVLNFNGGGERVVRRPVSRNPNLLVRHFLPLSA